MSTFAAKEVELQCSEFFQTPSILWLRRLGQQLSSTKFFISFPRKLLLLPVHSHHHHHHRGSLFDWQTFMARGGATCRIVHPVLWVRNESLLFDRLVFHRSRSGSKNLPQKKRAKAEIEKLSCHLFAMFQDLRFETRISLFVCRRQQKQIRWDEMRSDSILFDQMRFDQISLLVPSNSDASNKLGHRLARKQ